MKTLDMPKIDRAKDRQGEGQTNPRTGQGHRWESLSVAGLGSVRQWKEAPHIQCQRKKAPPPFFCRASIGTAVSRLSPGPLSPKAAP
ncbi:hypothetical protein D2Q93_15645 [Alicyclobacillaceae bacterium I2511]|nr:hypothetical protein D2Q93_15645 [Alicyclobacillaceae bacterium I2511]